MHSGHSSSRRPPHYYSIADVHPLIACAADYELSAGRCCREKACHGHEMPGGPLTRLGVGVAAMHAVGQILTIYPNNNWTHIRLGIDIFNQSALRGGALTTIQMRQMVVNGPLSLVNGNFGTITRIPVFIANASYNETFGTGEGGRSTGGPGSCASADAEARLRPWLVSAAPIAWQGLTVCL